MAPGLLLGKLYPCPNSLNCVNSEIDHKMSFCIFNSFSSKGLIQTVEAMGGRLQSEKNLYWAFSFRSGMFGFVDDLELRLDAKSQYLHMRSASRVGYSDRGVNQKRVQLLKNQKSQYFLDKDTNSVSILS